MEVAETELLSDRLTNLVEVLRDKARRLPEKEAYRFLLDGHNKTIRWSYGGLDLEARAVASALGERSLSGERAVLLFPPGLEFIAAFLGCLYQGVIAVPAYPPTSRRTLPRLEAILGDARPALVLTTAEVLTEARALFAVSPQLARLEWLAIDGPEVAAERESRAAAWRDPGITADTVAFLQYTSGSTAVPKGVVVRHGHLMHNQRMIQAGFGLTSESVIVGWLPLFHDMGLIGNVLQPLYLGARCVLMSPLAFLRRPARWLKAISRYRGTTSGGPNFAYELAAQRVSPDERQGFDLSSWTLAFNGAEPVRAGTLDRFCAAFAECGFRREAFYPCYGLAEATLFVSGGDPGRAPEVVTVESAALERHRVVEGSKAEEAGQRRLVGCGRVGLGERLLIVDPETCEPLAADRVGEIWVAGPSVAGGYWGQAGESERVFAARTAGGEGPFLRTGDLGFLRADGELVVTGRLKDLIILRGRNHYPQDIEMTSEASHAACRTGGCAAFPVEVGDEERLAVVQELEHRFRAEADQVAAAIRQAVSEKHQVHVHAVTLIRAGSLPKTSSGKVRRRPTRELFLAGKLDVVASSVAQSVSEVEAAGPDFNREELRLLEAGPRRKALAEFLRHLTARVVRQAPDAIDVAAPLTALGLDSLMAVELRNRCEAELGVTPPLAEVLDGASLEELAARLDASLTAPAVAAERLPELTPGGAEAASGPLSYGQRALWFLQRLAPESAAYNVAVALEVEGALNVHRLRWALYALGRRHGALRTVFRATGEGPRREVQVEPRVALTVEEAAPAELEERLARAVNAPFDLERDDLTRVLVLTLGERRHAVVVVLHHIICDLASLAVLLAELRMLYELPPERAADVLTPLPVTYSDYVEWQEQLLDSPAGERLWRYWRERLAGELPVLALPADRPRPPHQGFRGAARRIRFDAGLSAGVRALAEGHGTTVYTVLLAAFQTLLARYSGQREVLVGTPALGRDRPELEGLVGYFVNPVVMRADLSSRPAFGELLAAVRTTVIEALGHQDFPFALLVERLQPRRDPSRSPIFQAMFSFQRSEHLGVADLEAFVLGHGGVELDFTGLPARSLRFAQCIAQFDVELVAAELDGELGFSLLYDTDLFDGSTAARFLEHYHLFLRAVVEEPGSDVLALSLVGTAERQILFHEWNDSAARDGSEGIFHRLFEERAGRAPDRLAVACGDAALTYAELNRRANRLASALLASGAAPEERVAVLAERGLDLASAMLATFKAGAVYVPLDPRYPDERLRAILEPCGATALLVSGELRPLAERAAARLADVPRILELEALRDDQSRSAEDLPLEVSPAGLAYVIFTSGSTGVPKGAMVVHRGMANHLDAKIEDLAITAADRVAQNASQCFDISVWQYLAALQAGGSVVVFPDEVAHDPARLIAALEATGITLFETVPSMLRAMLAAPAPGPAGGQPAFTTLRWMIPTGEALTPEVGRLWLERQAGIPLVNAYGPTECSDDVTHAVLRRPPAADAPRVPIGRPIRNTRLHVLDAAFVPVPAGAAGELCVGGRGVGRGYLRDPWRTAEVFRPDPFAAAPGGRLYKTGDLARYLVDGQLEFFGRIDYQVKVRGFRVELEEIESVLSAHPAVHEAVVVARQDALDNARLIAYWVAHREVAQSSPDGAELRAWVAAALPEYMVPSIFMALASLPLTPNGKVDRKALPEPEPEPQRAPGRAAAPLAPTEELVAEIWAEVLGLAWVDPEQGFFDLGGHSLLATQVVSRLRDLLGVDVALRELFSNLTVRALAALVERRRRQEIEAALPPLVPILRQRDLPLSFAQERLWFLDQLQPGLVAYNMPAALVLRGAADRISVIEGALAELVRRHETLRTTFRTVEGKPVQVIGAAAAPRVPRVDLSALPRSTATVEGRRLAAEDADRSFDLSRGPLLRTTIVELGGGENLLLINMHHIVSDGWSLQVLVRELSALYRSFDAGQPSPLAELPVQYGDYAAWQRSWFTGELRERLLAYWREQLRGVPESLDLPMDRPRPPVQTFSGDTVAFSLPTELSDPLDSRARQQSVTLFMWLLASFQSVLHRYTGRRDVLVGSPIANRTRTEVEGLIGFFVNALVLRADMSGDPSFVELLGRIREVTLGAYMHQELSFEKLIEELRPERHLSHTPLFQVAFALQDPPFGGLELPGLTLSSLESYRKETAKFDLELYLWRAGRQQETLGGHFVYNTDLFDAATVRRLAGHFAALLEHTVTAPEQPVSELALLRAGEAHQLLTESNDTARAHPRSATLHELIVAQAMATPEATAVVFEETVLSYAELNRRANQLAHYLRRRGVDLEILVGVAMERSVELVIALVGVLKAGGTYVPLDPDYPPSRLAFMVEDSRPPVLLTQARLVERLPAVDCELLCLDTQWRSVRSSPGHDPAPVSAPENLAYVIFTSGSTGRPKGAMNSHWAVCNRLLWMQEAYNLGPGDRVLQKTPFSFDVSVWEFFWPLLTGASLVVARPQGHRDSGYLVRTIVESQITTLHFVPSMLRVFLEDPQAGTCASLRWVIASGEALTADLRDACAELLPARLENLYGPTEAAIDVTYWPCAGDTAPLVPIGRPVDNTRIHILDRCLAPVPLGVSGELLIGGVQLARGYLERPAMTGERFIPDPSPHAEPGSRVYRTGDLARYRTDHAVEYLGRIDQQVKLRGFRVELGEIEAVLQQHPGVHEAVVIPREVRPGDHRLTAYVVPDEEQARPLRRLLHFEREGLADGHQPWVLPNGMMVLHKNRGETEFLYQELFEDNAYLRQGVRLGPGACVFDIGANIGLFALFLARQWPGVKIYAFEPVPPVFELLGLNMELYGVDAHVDPRGLASAAGTAEIDYFPHATILSGRFVDGVSERETVKRFLLSAGDGGLASEQEIEELLSARLERQSFPCTLTTVSEVMRENGVERIDLLKVDVEKSELEVLAGIEEEDWPRIRQVAVEVHDEDGALRTVEEMLARHGFEVAVDQDRALAETSLYNVYGVRPEPSSPPGGGPQPEEGSCSGVPRWENPTQWIDDLRKWGLDQLPQYMVPALFVPLDSIPLSPNGKVDRAALAALPDPELAAPPDSAVAPRTPQEELLSGIWAEVLERPQVGIHDNFFDLGGHSLLATQVVSRVRALFNVDLALTRFFEAPTVAGIAARIEAAQASGQESPASPLAPQPRDRPLPLSFSQERMWFLEQLNPGNPFYNLPVHLHLHGRFSAAIFERVLTEVARRHEVLRTVFSTADGGPRQLVDAPAPLPMPVVDLAGLAPALRRSAVDRLSRDEARRPFDLVSDWPLRSVLVDESEEEHTVLLTLHHIASDGWSMGLLVREVMALYEAYAGGEASPLPDLPIQYADYAHWQRSWLSGEVLAEELAYWRRQLSDLPPVLELPADRQRPSELSYRGAELPVRMEHGLAGSLSRLARQESSTLFMVLMASFQMLLFRYTGQNRVSVGTPIAGRTRVETESLVGLFVNTLVLCGERRGDPSFQDYLGRVRGQTLEAYRHQDLPFEKLVEELSPERSLNYSPLFQVMLVLQNAPLQDFELAGLKIHPLAPSTGVLDVDLVLSLSEEGGGIAGLLEYSAELFDRSTMERFWRHYTTLLAGLAADPEQPLSSLALLGPAERAQVLREWNDHEREGPRERCLDRLFDAQVERRPDSSAVLFGDSWLSYAELSARANQVARHLRRRGVGPEVLVGLLMERSLELPVGVWGILKAGGGYLPLDPDYPRERLELMLGDTGVEVVLSQGRFRERLPGSGPSELVCLDEDWGEIARESRAGLGSWTTAENLAYVIYTSGSTGRPKGVVNRHGSVSSHLTFWRRLVPPRSEPDVLIQISPITFDLSVVELCTAFLTGARLVVARPGGHRDPAYVASELVRGRVTALEAVPAMHQHLLDEPQAKAFDALRLVIGGADVVSPELVKRHYSRLKADMVNAYGPTETTIDASCYWVSPSGELSRGVPIGRAIDNGEIYMVDRRLRPAPLGVPGELVIGGGGVTRGYWNRPGLTAEKFVPHPFNGKRGLRLYRTGDLARTLPDGLIHFIGRVDRQVKVRGFRIELGEIEAALARQDGVRDVAVTAWRASSSNTRLVAYVVAAGGAVEELRDRLREELPDYMVPSAWVMLDEMPLTPSGKVDRKALPPPDPEALAAAAGEFVEPKTPLESFLASVFAEVLELESVSTEASFFDLGGHSLMATQVVVLVQEVLPVQLELRDIFTTPTVAAIAAQIEEARATLSDAERELMDELLDDFMRMTEEEWEEEEGVPAH